jgi:hypothetical protein
MQVKGVSARDESGAAGRRQGKSPWLLAANVPAGAVLVLLILDPTRDLRPVLCLLAIAAGLFAVGTWGMRGQPPSARKRLRSILR